MTPASVAPAGGSQGTGQDLGRGGKMPVSLIPKALSATGAGQA